MHIQLLKSKITGVSITKVDLHCQGSFGIDQSVMERVGLHAYEKILVINMNNGNRFETYCIIEPAGSNEFALYGGAARLGTAGDPIIILSFAQMTEEEARLHQPKIFIAES